MFLCFRAESEGTIVTSVRTVTKTTTTTVSENVASAGQEAQKAFSGRACFFLCLRAVCSDLPGLCSVMMVLEHRYCVGQGVGCLTA